MIVKIDTVNKVIFIPLGITLGELLEITNNDMEGYTLYINQEISVPSLWDPNIFSVPYKITTTPSTGSPVIIKPESTAPENTKEWPIEYKGNCANCGVEYYIHKEE